MSKIYTKTGDRGKTSLFNGQRVAKSSDRVSAYGSVDEFNSLLGIIRSQIAEISKTKDWDSINSELAAIQHDLFTIGAGLANPASELLEGLTSRVLVFETTIDTLTEKLPSLANFILPGGSVVGALFHYARSICRSVERRIVLLSQQETVDTHILTYFNRLSDLLFTYARYANHLQNEKEIIWKQSLHPELNSR